MTTLSYDRAQGHATRYDVVGLGYNYRMDDVRGALAVAQLEKLKPGIQKRLAKAPRVSRGPARRLRRSTFPTGTMRSRRPTTSSRSSSSRADAAFRDGVRGRLAEAGIETSVHYPAVHRFSYYAPCARPLPRTEFVADHEITLPLYEGAVRRPDRLRRSSAREGAAAARACRRSRRSREPDDPREQPGGLGPAPGETVRRELVELVSRRVRRADAGRAGGRRRILPGLLADRSGRDPAAKPAEPGGPRERSASRPGLLADPLAGAGRTAIGSPSCCSRRRKRWTRARSTSETRSSWTGPSFSTRSAAKTWEKIEILIATIPGELIGPCRRLPQQGRAELLPEAQPQGRRARSRRRRWPSSSITCGSSTTTATRRGSRTGASAISSR